MKSASLAATRSDNDEKDHSGVEKLFRGIGLTTTIPRKITKIDHARIGKHRPRAAKAPEKANSFRRLLHKSDAPLFINVCVVVDTETNRKGYGSHKQAS
ncbi:MULTISPECIES: hypothetical protein [Methylocaldum]|jgi:hypothetical protein|uniref:hypothetical protein n=1 Tax=unclassified Methylocaldum TaxID=2622260 RepID=UPI00105C9C55|nr:MULTISPECIES: hypothetical protein [unclassified Methylocaldum]MBP1148438.1 hypothetical protein [Methylocaldum sp. RMAD-M]